MINNSFGAAFIGTLVTGILYGIAVLQTFYYYNHYPEDRKGTKVLVAAIWSLDTLHLVLVAIAMYHYLIINYDNRPALDDGHWSLFASIAANVAIAFASHWFFTFQIFRLCKKVMRCFVLIPIGLLNFIHFAYGIQTVVLLIKTKKFSRLDELSKSTFIPFVVLAIASDVFIAAVLCTSLQENKMGTARYHISEELTTLRTRSLINRLIAFAINRCLLTSVVAIAEVIVWKAKPHSLWFLAIDFVIGELWVNSLLASLNSRHSLASSGTTVLNRDMSGIDFNRAVEEGVTTDGRGIVLELQTHPSPVISVLPSQPAGYGQKDGSRTSIII